MDRDRLIEQAEIKLKAAFDELDKIETENTKRVLAAFGSQRLASRHFTGTTGYGYGDEGREALERVYAEVFGVEAALVRPLIASGTHALAVALFGALRPGQTLIYATGRPYDTMEEIIGITGSGEGSLKEFGISYKQVELKDGRVDITATLEAIDESTGLVVLQRSCGYDFRPSLSVNEIGQITAAIKAVHPHLNVMVDNCYGEFTDVIEPTHVGVDLMAGSLIKNPGGGIAPTGGYVAGREELVRRCATRMTSPGIGAEVGSYSPGYRLFFQGFFMAPHTVNQAVKGAMLIAQVFADMGYEVIPGPEQKRSDIIQAIKLGSPEKLVALCRAVQAASPVEAYVTPEPWEMPGYTSKVIMAAGAFVQGSSIELSADGPLREPYAAYIQGGLTYAHVKIALEKMVDSLAQ
ncbi:MAG: aminotransferase class I/II-fold pyridoxal phosphate-dependent enzyme [Christensenellales bacterium]|jgi:cystathionine beta-lyase family protein involved in aluminum resistance